jgi:hypothetical protein
MSKAKAEQLWRTFHDKENPRELIEVLRPWPSAWGLSGEATRVYYLSDKWQRDGKQQAYYHDHEGGVELWEPWGSQEWLEQRRKSPARSLPCSDATVLGYCLGWELTKVGTGEELDIEFGDKDALLCAVPSGKALFVVDAKSGEVIAAFVGGSLAVKPEGIVG